MKAIVYDGIWGVDCVIDCVGLDGKMSLMEKMEDMHMKYLTKKKMIA